MIKKTKMFDLNQIKNERLRSFIKQSGRFLKMDEKARTGYWERIGRLNEAAQLRLADFFEKDIEIEKQQSADIEMRKNKLLDDFIFEVRDLEGRVKKDVSEERERESQGEEKEKMDVLLRELETNNKK